jgi:exodeoxyribonuclease VII small subunit
MTKKTEEFDYGSKAAELEETLAKLQRPDIGIDEATRLHGEGIRLVHELEEYLKQAEIVVKKHVADSE